MSATKFPRPVRNRSSSLRRTDWPNTFVVWAMDSPLPGPHHLTRGRDGVDNARIPGAAADVPRYRGPNSVFRRCVFRLEQLERRKHDPGSAEPALETVVCLERLLNRMEPTVLGEALDRRDLPAVGLDREHRARFDGMAVQEDGTCAAMARITTDVGSREPELVPNEIHEQYARLDRTRERPAVHRDRDGVSAVLGSNALALRTCLLSLRGHPDHLPARAVAVSSARRVNTSIIARLYSSLPRRSHADLGEQLRGSQRGREGILEETVDGNRPSAVRSSRDELRFEGQERRPPVRGGIRVSERSPDRPEVADLRITEDAGDVREDRIFSPDEFRLFEITMSAQRPDSQPIAALLDEREARQTVDVHEHSWVGEAQLKHRDEALTARKDLRAIPVLAENLDCLRQGLRSHVIERMRLHRPPRRATNPHAFV